MNTALIFYITLIVSIAPRISFVRIRPGDNLNQVCRKNGLAGFQGTLSNISDAYRSLLNQRNVDEAFFETWLRDSRGWVMTRSGQLVPRRQYTRPIRHAICGPRSISPPRFQAVMEDLELSEELNDVFYDPNLILGLGDEYDNEEI